MGRLRGLERQRPAGRGVRVGRGQRRRSRQLFPRHERPDAEGSARERLRPGLVENGLGLRSCDEHDATRYQHADISGAISQRRLDGQAARLPLAAERHTRRIAVGRGELDSRSERARDIHAHRRNPRCRRGRRVSLERPRHRASSCAQSTPGRYRRHSRRRARSLAARRPGPRAGRRRRLPQPLRRARRHHQLRSAIRRRPELRLRVAARHSTRQKHLCGVPAQQDPARQRVPRCNR